jgi:hypothetical protein
MPLVEDAEGITLLSNWLIVLREDADFADKIQSGEVKDRERAYRLVLTLNHEGIHFLQGMTCALPYSYSVNLLGLCSELMEVSRAGKLDSGSFGSYCDRYADFARIFESPREGISTTDLMEAMAVVESFRATSTIVSPQRFGSYLQAFFPDPASTYRRVIDLVAHEFDLETALSLTSRLCFLALNGDVPAENFWYFLRRVSSSQKKTAKEMNALDLAELVRLDPRQFLVANYAMVMAKGGEHKILSPFIQRLRSTAEFEETFEFAARPGDCLRDAESPRFADIVPPLVLYSGGRGRVMGLAKQWNTEQLFTYVDAGALVGACQRLFRSGGLYLGCPWTECPLHETALCHAWYAIPTSDWSNCAFPKRLALHFGQSARALMDLHHTASPNANAGPGAGVPFWGRSKEEYRRLLNEAAALSNPEEWDRTVISLLAEAEIENVQYALTDNTSYLVISVAGYLLDMGVPLPFNCFNVWMNEGEPRLSVEYLIQFRVICRGLGKDVSPWFGLALLLALEIILKVRSPNPNASDAIPAWLRPEIQQMAEIIKSQRLG